MHVQTAEILIQDFYPRPPRGGRPLDRFGVVQGQVISIHALREEGDSPVRRSLSGCSITFLSTPSARRATVAGSRRWVVTHISIHALREEGDAAGSFCTASRS